MYYMFGYTGIDPETVCYLDCDPDRTGIAEPDPTRRVTAVARRDTMCHAMTAVTLSDSELHERGRNRTWCFLPFYGFIICGSEKKNLPNLRIPN
jgi:hypothetical protein